MIPLFLAACDVPCDDADATCAGTGTAEQPLRVSALEVKSKPNGNLDVPVTIGAGDTAFQVVLEGNGIYPILSQLRGPDGKVVLDREDFTPQENLTQAFYFIEETSTFNWPIRLEDGPLEPGEWSTRWLVVDRSGFGTNGPLDAAIATKRDPDPEHAEIHVRILWARGVAGEVRVVNAVEEAVEHWREIWARQDITLVERYEESDLDPDLKFTYGGSKAVTEASTGKDDGELQLVVGETVDSDYYVYGVAGGIPGPIVPSKNTFVVLAWTSHAGYDGRFQPDEIDLMGETMAHEIGHYTGLFHPVEESYSAWDLLGDTPECTSGVRCEDELGKNLMFPYSLCFRDGCENQTVLTADQRGVLQTFVGAL